MTLISSAPVKEAELILIVTRRADGLKAIGECLDLLYLFGRKDDLLASKAVALRNPTLLSPPPQGLP
jgi:hypothetical protein